MWVGAPEGHEFQDWLDRVVGTDFFEKRTRKGLKVQATLDVERLPI